MVGVCQTFSSSTISPVWFDHSLVTLLSEDMICFLAGASIMRYPGPLVSQESLSCAYHSRLSACQCCRLGIPQHQGSFRLCGPQSSMESYMRMRCPRHLTGSDSGALWQHRSTDPYWEETVWQIWNDIRGETRLCPCPFIVLHRHWLDPKLHAYKARNPHRQLSVLRSCICRRYSILHSVCLRCSWLPVKFQWIIISSRYARVMAQDQVTEPGFWEPTTQHLYARRKYSWIRG